MMRAASTMMRRLRGFLRAQGGTAAVEFALILPVMLAVYIGTVEASALISTDRKVQSVAGAVGDLVARVEGEVTTAQLEDYFQAAAGIMTPMDTNRVRQVVTAIAVTEDGETRVVWSRQYDGHTMSTSTPYAVGDEYPLPDAMTNIARGQMVIAGEAIYPAYTPIFGIVFDEPVTLYRSSFFLPRFGGTIRVN